MYPRQEKIVVEAFAAIRMAGSVTNTKKNQVFLMQVLTVDTSATGHF